jgi:hypothetical protein
LREIFIFDLLLDRLKGSFLDIFHGYPLVWAEVHDGDVCEIPQTSPKFDVLGAYGVLFLIVLPKQFKDALVSRVLETVFAVDHLECSSSFCNEPKLIAQKFEFADDAGGGLQDGLALDGLVEFPLEIDVFLDKQLDEVAIDYKAVGVVEEVIDSEEIDDSVYLLIVHQGYTIIKASFPSRRG